ncbi:MAG: Gfo/Idh/MocA family oxidoreductase [Verrucomicrobia bacterium]|nr:Gfo/Idh/MocA family oxidoreductase [Verrucomicrobiota bacterium]
MKCADSIGVCVVGCGRAGLIHARTFAGGVRGARLAALVDPVAEALQAASTELKPGASYSDFQQAIEDNNVHAVVIVAPTAFHRDIALAAAAAGKHILCEKPMAMTPGECDDMIRAAERHRVKLQIGFMLRFDAGFLAAKQRLDAGEIGDVVLVKSLTHGPSIPKPWMYDIRKSNGPLAEVNSHDIDTLRWFTGSEFAEVFAVAGNYRCPDAKKDFPDFYDNVVLTARFHNGMQGVISGAQGVGYGYDARCEVLGQRGIITAGAWPGPGMSKGWQSLFVDAYRAEDEDFIRCILEDRPPRVTGLDGKRAVEVVNAGNQSIRERRPVTL